MQIVETEYLSVRDRVAELGCRLPEIALLPENFLDAHSWQELRVRGEGVALHAVFENANMPLGSFSPMVEHVAFGRDRALDWEAGLFLSSNLVAREPGLAATALSLIAGHLDDYFKGHGGRKAGLTLVVERRDDHGCRKLVYEGAPAALRTLAERATKIAQG
jgi:hypothetical protein